MTNPLANGARLPLLLIEDEPSVMAYVRAALERSGYPVVAANSGAEALRLLAGGSFLGVISDMRTPGGVDGADVHAWIAGHRPELATRLIFITGDIISERTRKFLEQQNKICLPKPFTISEFRAAIKKVLMAE